MRRSFISVFFCLSLCVMISCGSEIGVKQYSSYKDQVPLNIFTPDVGRDDEGVVRSPMSAECDPSDPDCVEDDL